MRRDEIVVGGTYEGKRHKEQRKVKSISGPLYPGGPVLVTYEAPPPWFSGSCSTLAFARWAIRRVDTP